VRHWRELRGVRQQDLAEQAGIEVTRLCRIELGHLDPRAEEIEDIAKALGMTMPEFYGATDEAKAS
jgi:transcriptional regulator with XRE-family HTH domain